MAGKIEGQIMLFFGQAGLSGAKREAGFTLSVTFFVLWGFTSCRQNIVGSKL
jgi:hypothetical protein